MDEEPGWHRCTDTGSGIHSAASLTKTIQIRLSAVSIMVGVALPIIDKFDNVYILWVNNASTSFFTLFHSLNFIFTAYFA